MLRPERSAPPGELLYRGNHVGYGERLMHQAISAAELVCEQVGAACHVDDR